MKPRDIDLLEQAAKCYQPSRKWTSEERDMLRRFYGRVPTTLLAQKLGRTGKAIQSQWQSMRGVA
jgi:hypothetical protein